MARQTSAGILVYRRRAGTVEFLLVHPGGPFWKNRERGAWSIPKGLVDEGEENLAAAIREFEEEVGQTVAGQFTELTPVRQKSGKVVAGWLVEADLDLAEIRSNLIELEWPRRSGRRISIPEVDRAAYLPPEEALEKIHPGQRPILIEALDRLGLPQGRGEA